MRAKLEKLKKNWGIKRLMVAGGGLINWTFVQEDLMDELSLVVSPVTDGSRTAAAVFEKADFLPERKPAAFSLKDVQKLNGGGVWLRYVRKL